MARDHKGQGNILVEPSEHTPQQVSYHGVVLVLCRYHCLLRVSPDGMIRSGSSAMYYTVVSVEVDILLAKPMYFKEVMEHADDGIGSLTSVDGLVNKVIDLTWDSLTAHSLHRWHTFLGLGSTWALAVWGHLAGPYQKSSEP